MTATCVRTERSATADEIAELAGNRRQDVSAVFSIVLLTLPFMLGGWALGAGLESRLVQWSGVLLSPALAAWLTFGFRRYAKSIRLREDRDLDEGRIEVLEIAGAEVLLVEATHNSVDPGFLVELPNGRTLILAGPWLAEPEVYGGAPDFGSDEEDELEKFANFLPPPYAFPTDGFTVHRFPASGHVVKIDLTGEYQHPASAPASVDLSKVNDAPSRVLNCSFEAVEAAIDTLSASGNR